MAARFRGPQATTGDDAPILDYNSSPAQRGRKYGGGGDGDGSLIAKFALGIAIVALLGVAASFTVFGLMGNRHSDRIDTCKSDVSTLQTDVTALETIDGTLVSQPCNCSAVANTTNACVDGAVFLNFTGNITTLETCTY